MARELGRSSRIRREKKTGVVKGRIILSDAWEMQKDVHERRWERGREGGRMGGRERD